MKRAMQLFFFVAGAALAQSGNNCPPAVYNLNTHVSYVPGCPIETAIGAPILQSISKIGEVNNLPEYRVYAETLGGQPSMCVGQAEPYSVTSNSFLDPTSLPAGATVEWIYVCRHVNVLTTSNGYMDVTMEAPLSLNTASGVPVQDRPPMVMLTNNTTKTSSVAFYYTAPYVMEPAQGTQITEVVSMGSNPAAGLSEYEIRGYGFGQSSVQLLTVQDIVTDSLGAVRSQSPVPITGLLHSVGTPVWLPVAQQPQVVEAEPSWVDFVTYTLDAWPGLSALNPPKGVKPVVRGYLFTHHGSAIVCMPFNFVP